MFKVNYDDQVYDAAYSAINEANKLIVEGQELGNMRLNDYYKFSLMREQEITKYFVKLARIFKINKIINENKKSISYE